MTFIGIWLALLALSLAAGNQLTNGNWLLTICLVAIAVINLWLSYINWDARRDSDR